MDFNILYDSYIIIIKLIKTHPRGYKTIPIYKHIKQTLEVIKSQRNYIVK